MDDLDVAVGIPATHDAYVTVSGIEHKITGLGFAPRDGVAVVVLGDAPATLTNDIASAGDVVKYPVYKPGTVHAVRSGGSGGRASGGGDDSRCSPAGVPSENKRLASPEVVDLTNKRQSVLDDHAALDGQVLREPIPKCQGSGVRNVQIG